MKSKTGSLAAIFIVYILAFCLGAVSLYFLAPYLGPLLNMFVATFVATVGVYLSYFVFKNASVYDPYWSVQPPLLILGFYWIYRVPFQAVHLFVLVPLVIWAVRLTVNWAIGFENLKWQDWRYTDMQKNNPAIAHLMMFTNIMLFPTTLVYFGVVPGWFMLNTPSLHPVLAAVSGLIILTGTALEATADSQMRAYKKDPREGTCINRGLWKYSRHPNYLGEILIWVGFFVSGLQNFSPLSLIGVISIILLFNFISIPMMEKHILSKRPEYVSYQKEVSRLFPLPPRKTSGN